MEHLRYVNNTHQYVAFYPDWSSKCSVGCGVAKSRLNLKETKAQMCRLSFLTSICETDSPGNIKLL